MFTVFLAIVGAGFGVTFLLECVGILEKVSWNMFWALMVLFEPVVMVRRALSDVPQETYIYLTAMGLADFLALFVFYFLVCFVLAWCWTLAESIKNRT